MLYTTKIIKLYMTVYFIGYFPWYTFLSPLPFSFIKAIIFIVFYSTLVGLRKSYKEGFSHLTLDVLVFFTSLNHCHLDLCEIQVRLTDSESVVTIVGAGKES